MSTSSSSSNSTPQHQFDLKKLKLLSLEQLRKMPFPARTHIIDPWLVSGESALIYAAPGIGKTWINLTLALMAAGGGSALGWKSPQPRKVMIIDGEMSTTDLRDRLESLIPSAITGLDIEAADKNLILLPRQFQTDTSSSFVDIAKPSTHEALLGYIKSLGTELLLLDSYTTLSLSLDSEDASSDFRKIMEFLLKCKQSQITVILSHHARKDGGSYRGSSAIATSFEVILSLKKTDQAMIDQTCAFEILWEKYRGKRSDVTESTKVWLQEDPKNPEARQWGYEASEDRMITKMLALLRSCAYSTQSALAAAMETSEATLSRLKKRAIGEDRIQRSQWRSLMKAAAEDDLGNITGIPDTDEF